MKKFAVSSLFAALALAGIPQLASAADGEINFSGDITANTCAIVITDPNGGSTGNVNLGSVQASSLANAGDVAGGNAFSLTVDTSGGNCDITGKQAKVTFLALSGAAGPSGQWLGTDGGSARNVAIQLKDASGREVAIGSPSSDYLDLAEPMRFTANYIATGTAAPGPVTAKASFTVDIQ
ncbi:type 1 fimbrial protein [Pseudomonas sp. B21-032]|uniref:fimbrial protein n=1 Tax=Pseudomonas TaxID=286 RepID=UPI00215FECCF|nr:fimbrial protein [Pseudomonas sp. B21-032]UVL63657.1 type 1 fimbrial protein [Pseudomonas sp. B21-032]